MKHVCIGAVIAISALLAPLAVAQPQTIFEVTSFSLPSQTIQYPGGFSGTVGVTATWPNEMGWQGDRIDIAFNLAGAPPVNAANYRLRIVMNAQYSQNFTMGVLAGPSLASLTEVKSEFIDTARVLSATIPVSSFVAGQTNYIRLQGTGVLVGTGNPAGVRWNRWTLTRTDPPMNASALRLDQMQRCANFTRDAILANGLVRDALLHSPSGSPFHPATPDAAGFALLALPAADRFGLLPNAEELTERVLRAYAGDQPGVTPLRNTVGHYRHWMSISNGGAAAGWPTEFTTIGSALLGAGALFAKNHFRDNPQIVAWADEIFATCNWDSMIDPALNGRVMLATNASGGATGTLTPWNEYMLVVSMARHQPGATRAPAIAHLWIDPPQLPMRFYADIPTLTDSLSNYAPAFWVQQQYFFNPDFAGNPALRQLFENQRRADELACALAGQRYRYGLTAGVNPSGYSADSITNFNSVYSPSAVGGWRDLDTLLEFAQQQPPNSDSRFRYGLTRVSGVQPTWLPPDAALVDHLFLMYGLVELIEPNFFRARQPFQPDGDQDGLADAFDNCPSRFNRLQDDTDNDGTGDACACGTNWADRDDDGDVDLLDFAQIQACPPAGEPLPESCYCFDRDQSQTLGGPDVSAFGECLNTSGPGVSATCGG